MMGTFRPMDGKMHGKMNGNKSKMKGENGTRQEEMKS
jgi:hypothetical protein